MNKIYLLLLLICFSCAKKIEKNQLDKINGYWEIQSVKLADGTTKDYKVNETVDFFEIKANKGFRQKVMPQLNGKFLTNNLKETVHIVENNQKFYLNYQTKYGKWQDEILAIEDSVLTLKSPEKIQYIYKRFIPFTLKNEQKIK